jgi:hypothetical protein
MLLKPYEYITIALRDTDHPAGSSCDLTRPLFDATKPARGDDGNE